MEKATLNATIEKDILEDAARILSGQILDMGLVRSRDVVNELDLYDFHKPSLAQGDYTVDVEQTIKIDGYTNPETYKTTVKLKVAKPPLALAPTDVFQMYPPKGAFGRYAPYLPYLVLNKSTFPWEMPHYSKSADTPWLALIVMDETEGGALVSPGQKVKIDANLIPTKEDLNFLVHASKRNKPQAGARKLSPEAKAEKAVLIANRFPTPGKTNVVYLIALDEKPANGQYTSLFSWNFACETEGKDGLKHLLNNLNDGPFRLPDFELPATATAKEQTIANQRKEQQSKGFVPLPHHNRVGLKMMSWYRGPLVPDLDFAKSEDQTLINLKAINSSDQLLRYFQATKKLDVTYAAAWELGKWLTLKNKEVSIELFKWKRAVATALKVKKQKAATDDPKLNEFQKVQKSIGAMFTKNQDIEIPEMTKDIKDWLQELLFLHPIPFSYLVPDERLLPAESIRFFTIDEGWLWALIDGALSIGRNPTERNAPPFGAPQLNLSGCLIRSDAISQFPHLQIKVPGFELLEKRVIGRNIWFCVFKKEDNSAQPIDKVELFLPAAGMRFGGENVSGVIKKELQDNSATIEIPFDHVDKRVLNVPMLYNRLLKKGDNDATAAGVSKSSLWAYNMIQAPPKVVFNK